MRRAILVPVIGSFVLAISACGLYFDGHGTAHEPLGGADAAVEPANDGGTPCGGDAVVVDDGGSYLPDAEVITSDGGVYRPDADVAFDGGSYLPDAAMYGADAGVGP